MRRRTTGPIEYAEARGFRKPLLAYDGSEGADRALELAVELASSSHGRLTIITAVAQIPFLAYTGASPEAVNELRRVTIEEGQRALCRAVDRIPQGIPVTKVLSRKPIQEALVQQARAGDHDLVILGARRRGTIRAVLQGSLGRDILRRSPLPVLIAAEEADGRAERLAGAPVVPMTPKQA